MGWLTVLTQIFKNRKFNPQFHSDLVTHFGLLFSVVKVNSFISKVHCHTMSL